MPMPTTIAVFTDADGDEFPVTLIGHWTEDGAYREGLRQLQAATRDGFIRPNGEPTLDRIEYHD